MYSTRVKALFPCLPIAALALAFSPPAALADSLDNPNVVGGAPVPRGEWRATAGIVANGQVICTGVLVAPSVVMTAGHCISPAVQGVVLDINTLANETIDQAEQIAAVKVVEYPNWENSYDLGLLVLQTPSRVEPRILAHGCARERFIADQAPVTIVGYGAIDANGQQYVNELMQADTIITDYQCADLGHGCNPTIQPDGELGAGGGGIDSCFGDSGGPLYLRTESGDFVVGLTSRGYADNTLPCSQGGIYVRLDSPIVRAWIEAEGGITLPESNCGLPPAPTPQTIEVETGGSKDVNIAANDPDGDVHTYAVATAPLYGQITVSPSGDIEYTAAEDYEGPDSFEIAVTDDDIPRHTVNALVTVNVVPGGCGCRSSEPPLGSAWLLLAVGLFLRPRRAKPGQL